MLTRLVALQPHSRRPLRRIRCRIMGILYLRERAHGEEADRRANQGDWQA